MFSISMHSDSVFIPLSLSCLRPLRSPLLSVAQQEKAERAWTTVSVRGRQGSVKVSF